MLTPLPASRNFTRVTLFQRIMFREISTSFMLTACILLAIILISRSVQMRELFLGLDLGLLDTAMLFGYMTPIFMTLVVPVACMLSVFLTLLRMNTDREFIALKAGGVSFYQMLSAPVAFSLLCMGLTLWISLHWLSWGMGHFRAMVLDIATNRARIVVQPGVFNREFPGLVLFARNVDPANGVMSGVVVDDRSRPEANVLILAPNGRIETDPARGDLVFRLRDGSLYNFRGDTATLLGFEEYAVRLALDKMFRGLDLGPIKPREMAWKMLTAFDRRELMAKEPAFARKVEVELHKRWLYPVACLALTLFVLPLASMFEGLHRQYGLILALAFFFVYYLLLSLGFSTGESGAVPPIIGLWLPNALFFAGGLYGIRLAARERAPHLFELLQHRRRNAAGLA
ncbi:MAG: LPS export ABC transporter permease LptF [Deltaproteobacteria bacterium]|jgi:lipopolysaccharide export system permease protein|nr:LPS export ABC transporter permease LptF [Deltaproteobacteria bacterium]